MRLTGATPAQVRRIAAVEAAFPSCPARWPAVAVFAVLLAAAGHAPPPVVWAGFAVVVLAVPVAAALVGVLALRRVVASPLDEVRRVGPERGPRAAFGFLTAGALISAVGMLLIGPTSLRAAAFPVTGGGPGVPHRDGGHLGGRRVRRVPGPAAHPQGASSPRSSSPRDGSRTTPGRPRVPMRRCCWSPSSESPSSACGGSCSKSSTTAGPWRKTWRSTPPASTSPEPPCWSPWRSACADSPWGPPSRWRRAAGLAAQAAARGARTVLARAAILETALPWRRRFCSRASEATAVYVAYARIAGDRLR